MGQLRAVGCHILLLPSVCRHDCLVRGAAARSCSLPLGGLTRLALFQPQGCR